MIVNTSYSWHNLVEWRPCGTNILRSFIRKKVALSKQLNFWWMWSVSPTKRVFGSFQSLFTHTFRAPNHHWTVPKQGWNFSVLVIGCYFHLCSIHTLRFQFATERCKWLAVKWRPIMATVSLTKPPCKLGFLLFYAIIPSTDTRTEKEKDNLSCNAC